MQHFCPIHDLGSVVERLALYSARPRYAFMLLQLLSEAADSRGRAGPFIRTENVSATIRDWLVIKLMPMSARDSRRETLRARVAEGLADSLTGIAEADDLVIKKEMDHQALMIGRQNVSRAISDLVKAGLLMRHYAGYATNHANRGAGRHAVYVLCPDTMTALGKTAITEHRHQSVDSARQRDLFAS